MRERYIAAETGFVFPEQLDISFAVISELIKDKGSTIILYIEAYI